MSENKIVKKVEQRGQDTPVPKNQNFFRALVSDDNNISEGNLIGLISFALFVLIVVVDILAPKLNIEQAYIGHLVNLTIAFFGVGGAVKGFKAFARKTTTFEYPEE